MDKKKPTESLERLQQSLQKKEREANIAKEKGQQSVYSNLMLEINLIKTKIKKFQMGRK
ncbi:MAG: hypothetical protein FWH53_09005 [Leptospirales bacterium]|nr:hypothetical protein [Leptospirales bacterium]